jgi:tRNA nucleotidyltransferase (CCA-adding enzyme)
MRCERFRQWLIDRGCTVQPDRGERGRPASLTIRRGERQATLPALGPDDPVDDRTVNQVVDRLGLARADLPGRWEHFPHEADMGVRGIGCTLDRAFAEAARAMTAVIVDPDEIRPETAVDISCEGATAEDLLYAWLNALVYEMAVRRMIFGRFAVEIEGGALRATATGEPVSQTRHEPAVEVKGATMTALSVRRSGDDWVAQCVVDV